MKKLLFVFTMFFCVPAIALSATTALYRISSGEVYAISLAGDLFANNAGRFFAVKEGATFPNGTNCGVGRSARRVLGTSKIVDGDIIRNSTQAEIDVFAGLERDDFNIVQAEETLDYLNNDKKFRRIMIALIKGIIREDNENRQWIRDFKAAVAASTSLADFQSRVAALDTPVDREFQDAKDYIISQVSKDD